MSKAEWKVDNSRCYHDCDHAEHLPSHIISINRDLWHVLCAMLKKFNDSEWQMLLTGHVENNTCFCDGYIIPKQEVAAATVSHVDEITNTDLVEKHIVATIHSHVNMGVFASQTDVNDSVMSLIDYHVIINNKREVEGIRKVQLPCGGVSKAECDVVVEGSIDLDAIVIVGTENISKKIYKTEWTPPKRDVDMYDERSMGTHLLQHGGY